jgi:hypothetical protein
MSGKWFLCAVAAAIAWLIWNASPHGHGRREGEVAIMTEIGQLRNALQAYKEKHLAYPPSLADKNIAVRKEKLLKHLRAVYPSSAYGNKADDFDRLNALVTEQYPMPYGPNGKVGLDLLQLGPAEATVFWLGGFPTPAGADGKPIAPSKLFGFNKDPDDPLKRSLKLEVADPLATRTHSRFDFRQERLVDSDGDGWWEYVPHVPRDNPAPFVYFDSDVYVVAPGGDAKHAPPIFPTDPKLAERWGTVCPFAAYLDPSGKAQTRWRNPDSFQIVCGGIDGKYSAPSAPLRTTIFPTGYTYVGPSFSGAPGNYSDEELDNLTNFVRLTLAEAKADAD